MTIVSENTTSTITDTNRYSLPGVDWLAVEIDGTQGTLTVGTVEIPVQVTPPVDGSPARIEADPGQLTLSAISAAAVSAGGTDPLAALPTALAEFLGGIAISRVGVTIDLSARAITAADIVVTAEQPWSVLPGHLDLTDLHVDLGYTRAGDSYTLAVTGGGSMFGSAVEITVQRNDSGSFSISVHGPDGADIAVPSFAEVANLVGGAELSLPDGVADLPGLVVSGVELVLSDAGVDSVHAAVATASAWNLPDPIGITIDQLSFTIAAEHVADAAARTVELTVQGSATFAGAVITVTLNRAAGQWTLTGGLQEGSTLTASKIATAYGAGLPAHLPELTLSAFAITAVLGTGELTVTAASTTEWTVPIGPSGIGVGALAIAFAHHAPDADQRSFTGSISGEVHLGGVVVPVSYAVPGGLTLTAKLPEFAPFAMLQDLCGATVVGSLALPSELLALSLTDLELEIDVERAEASFAATGPGFKRVQAIVRKSTSWGFAVGISLDDSYKFSSLTPALGGLDSVHLPDALIVISTFDDTAFSFDELQPIAGTGVSRGLLVDGRLDLSGLGADKFLGKAELDVKAHVGAKLSDLALTAGIGDVTIADGVVLKDAEFELVPDPENISISVSGAVDVTIDASPLEFVGGVVVVPNGISFFATMLGTWKDPFGAKGIALTNVSLQVGSSFEGVPSIAIAGGLQIGAFAGSAAVSFNSEFPTQSVLMVAFNHLSLMDVIGTFCPPSVTVGIPSDVGRLLAGISMDDVELYVVPQDTSIGKIKFDQGLRATGTMNVAGFTASAKVEIDPVQGVEVAGSMSPVHIADIFSLTADGSDLGPSLDIQVKATAIPKVAITGQASLLGVTAAAHVFLSENGFDFGCTGMVFGLFDAEVTAKGASLQSADGFAVHAQMSQDFLSKLAVAAAGVLNQAGKDAAGQIDKAHIDVTTADAEVQRLTTAVTNAQGDLDAARIDADNKIGAAQAAVTQAKLALGTIDQQMVDTRATIQGERDAAAAKIADAKAKVAAAQGPVDTLNAQISGFQGQINQLNAQIDGLNNWYYGLGVLQKAKNALSWTKQVGECKATILGLNGAILGLQGSVAAANKILDAAQKILQAAQAAAVSYPIDSDPRMVALQKSRDVAQFAFQTAQDALALAQKAASAGITAASDSLQELVRQSGAATDVLNTANKGLTLLQQGIGDVAAVADYVVQHGLDGLLDVRSASFEGSLSATTGGVVTLDAVAVFQGTTQTVHVSYDFHDFVAGAKALAKAALPSLPI